MYTIKKIMAGLIPTLILALVVSCGSSNDPLGNQNASGGSLEDQTPKTYITGIVTSVAGEQASVAAPSKAATLVMSPIKRVGRPRALQYQYEYIYEYNSDDSSEYESYSEQYNDDDDGYEYESTYEYAYEYCGYEVYDSDDLVWEEDDESSEEDADEEFEEVADESEIEDESVDFSDIVVFAMDAEGERTASPCNADGSFDLALTIGKSYVIGFSDGTNFLGVLTFATESSGSLGGSSLHLSGISDVIDLGAVTISDGLAFCENNPMEEEDQDADGVSDFEDEDFEYEESYSCESESVYEHYYESGSWGDDDNCSEDDEVCIQ